MQHPHAQLAGRGAGLVELAGAEASMVYIEPGNDDSTSHFTPMVRASASLRGQSLTTSPWLTCRMTGRTPAARHMSRISAALRGKALTPTHA
jgi:hypothetical protein